MVNRLPLQLAVLGGATLAVMTALNSGLNLYVSAVVASWIAHGIGTLTALLMLVSFARFEQSSQGTVSSKPPWWSYLGGIAGGLLVVLIVIAVNSFLGLTGTLVLAILGQVLFGVISDHLGWFGLQRQRLSWHKASYMVLVFVGALLIIYAKGALR